MFWRIPACMETFRYLLVWSIWYQLIFYIHHKPIIRKVDILYFSLCLAHWTFVRSFELCWKKPYIRPKICISKTPNIKMLWPSENTRILEWNFIAIWFDASSKFQTNVQMNFVRKYVFVSKFFFHGNYVDCLYFTIVLFISLNQVNVLRVLFGNIGFSQVDCNPLGVFGVYFYRISDLCRKTPASYLVILKLLIPN